MPLFVWGRFLAFYNSNFYVANSEPTCHQFVHCHWVDGLAQIIVHAAVKAFFSTSCDGISRNGDHGYVQPPSLLNLFYDLTSLKAIKAGHLTVEENHVVAVFIESTNSFNAVGCYVNYEA